MPGEIDMAQEKNEYSCRACTRGITEAQLDSGEALKRRGEIYCRECFRKEFPGECEYHPGEKLSATCFVCGRMFCANCIIEIQGKKVCARCKDWAVDRVQKGLALMRPEIPPWESWDQKEVRDWVSRPPRNWKKDLLITAVCVAFAFLFFNNAFGLRIGLNIVGFQMALVVLGANLYFSSWHFWRKKRLLRSTYINGHSVTTQTFAEGLRGARWENVKSVTMYMDPNFSRTLSITIRTQPSKFKIPAGRFMRFQESARAVREICREKGIPCHEYRKFSLSLDTLRRKLRNECALHPGEKLTLRCGACRHWCCEKCVTEHEGDKLCARCMEWAAGGVNVIMQDRARKPVGRYILLGIGFFAVPPIAACFATLFHSVYGMVYGIPVLYVLYFVAFGILINPWRLRTVTVRGERVEGFYYSGKRVEAPFSDVTGVVYGGYGAGRFVELRTPRGSLKIHGRFPRFYELSYRIHRICKDRNIPFKQS